MMVLRFLITTAAVPLCGYFMSGVVVTDMVQAALAGAVLAAVYTLLHPLAKLILSVFNFCTLGLLQVVADAWLVWTAAGFFREGVRFENFWWAVAVAVVINALRTGMDMVFGHAK